jgi:hypothetical protein
MLALLPCLGVDAMYAVLAQLLFLAAMVDRGEEEEVRRGR